MRHENITSAHNLRIQLTTTTKISLEGERNVKKNWTPFLACRYLRSKLALTMEVAMYTVEYFQGTFFGLFSFLRCQ